MNKETYILTIEYDTEAIDTGDLLKALNITPERGHELIHMAEKDGLSRGEGSSDKPYDAFAGLLEILPTLSGNEIFFYLINGFTIEPKMRMMQRRDPLMDLLRDMFNERQ